jgi:hypothetical protein
MVQLQDSISERLHHHTLCIMLFNGTFKVHHARISIVLAQGQAFSLQFDQFSWPFDYLPQFLSQHFVHDLTIVSISRCVCTHPIDPMGIHLLCCVHNNKHKGIHDVICSRHLCCHCARCRFSRATRTITYTSFNHIELLSLTSRHCAYQKWCSPLSKCCHCRPNVTRFISLMWRNLKICYVQCNSSQGKELLQPTPQWSIFPLSNWGIWLLRQTCQCVFTRLCQCHLELEVDRGPLSFYLGHFSS